MSALEQVAVEPETLNRKQAARLLNVSLATLDRMHVGGRMPAALRLGACVRWTRTELVAWLAAGCPDRNSWERRRR